MKQFLKKLANLLTIAACLLTLSPNLVIADEYPEETNPPMEAVTYGQTLGNVPLLESTVGGVPGAWSWTDPSIKPEAGTEDYEATFTPNDTANYNTITAMISVTTGQATPIPDGMPMPTDITYGQSLGESSITGGSVKGVNGELLTGTWSWPDTTLKPEAGMQDVSVKFTPDSANYTFIPVNTKINVKQFAPSAEAAAAPSAGEITYGQSLADSALTGGSVLGAEGTAIPGAWSWNDATVKPTAGTAEYAVTFTPSDTKNYATVSVNVPVTTKKYTVDPSNPDEPHKVTAPTSSEITYGQSLADSVLTEGSVNGLEGTFAWSDASIKPNAGTTAYDVLFTPADTNFDAFTVSVTITIAKATPVLADSETPTAAQITYGQSLNDSILSK